MIHSSIPVEVPHPTNDWDTFNVEHYLASTWICALHACALHANENQTFDGQGHRGPVYVHSSMVQEKKHYIRLCYQ